MPTWSSTEPSLIGAYASAIAGTRETLTTCAIQYKWLVVAVVIICAAAIINALVLQEWRHLMTLLLLPSAILTFCAMDGLAVQRWRAGILSSWSVDHLRLDILLQTLRQIPGLPPDTLEGMLTCLPGWQPTEVPTFSRPPVSQIQRVVDRIATERLLGHAMGWAVVAGVVLAATFSRSYFVPHMGSGLAFLKSKSPVPVHSITPGIRSCRFLHSGF